MNNIDLGREDIVELSYDWKNNIGFKPAGYDYAEDFIIFCVIYPILLLFGNLIGHGENPFIKSFIVLAAFILMTTNRRYSKRILIYVLFQILIAAVILIISVLLSEKIIFNLCTAVAIIVSVHKLTDSIARADKNLEHKKVRYNLFMGLSTVYISAALAYIVYMVAFFLKLNDIMFACFISFAVSFASIIIYLHKSGVYCFTKWNIGGQGESRGTGVMFSLWAAAGVGLLSLLSYLFVSITGLSRLDAALISFLTTRRKTRPVLPPSQPSSKVSGGGFSTLVNQQQDLSGQILNGIFSAVEWALISIAVIILLLGNQPLDHEAF